MRILVNEPLIRRQATRGQRVMTAGFALLVIAVLLSLQPKSVALAYGAMIVGLITLNIGVAIGGKWLRKPRPDQLLDKVLKDVDHGSRLYNYLLPVDHAILSSAGFFVLTLKGQDGRITCRGEKWRRRLGLWSTVRALFEAPLGNPSRQARRESDALRRWLAAKLPETEVPVQPAIVFVHPQVELEVEDPAVPAVTLRNLKGYLREATKEKAVSQATLKSLAALCDEQAT